MVTQRHSMSVTRLINQKMGCFSLSYIHGWVNYGASISVQSTHSLEIGNSKKEGNRGYWSGGKYLCFFGGIGTDLKIRGL